MMQTAKKVSVSITEVGPLLHELLEGGGTAELTVTGRSMRPMLLDRVSIVRISAPQRLRRGDVVLFRHFSGKYLLHRIVSCGKDGTFCCRGDARIASEPDVSRDQILAVVTDFCRKSRWTSCQSFGYGCYRALWLATFPLRALMLRAWGHVKRKRNKTCCKEEDER